MGLIAGPSRIDRVGNPLRGFVDEELFSTLKPFLHQHKFASLLYCHFCGKCFDKLHSSTNSDIYSQVSPFHEHSGEPSFFLAYYIGKKEVTFGQFSFSKSR